MKPTSTLARRRTCRRTVATTGLLAGGTMTPHRRLMLCTALLTLVAWPLLSSRADAAPGAADFDAALSQRVIRACGTPTPSAAELEPVRAAIRTRIEKFGISRAGATIP